MKLYRRRLFIKMNNEVSGIPVSARGRSFIKRIYSIIFPKITANTLTKKDWKIMNNCVRGSKRKIFKNWVTFWNSKRSKKAVAKRPDPKYRV